MSQKFLNKAPDADAGGPGSPSASPGGAPGRPASQMARSLEPVKLLLETGKSIRRRNSARRFWPYRSLSASTPPLSKIPSFDHVCLLKSNGRTGFRPRKFCVAAAPASPATNYPSVRKFF